MDYIISIVMVLPAGLIAWDNQKFVMFTKSQMAQVAIGQFL